MSIYFHDAFTQDYYKMVNHTDSLIIDNSNHRRTDDDKKTSKFYDTLQSKAHKRRFTREIYDKIILNNYSENSSLVQTIRGIDQYNVFKGREIRNIEIIQIDIFGPTIEDTSLRAETRIEKTGNRLHINTHKRVLQNKLLFEKGDILNPVIISDNERLLRELPYIQDVRFIIKKVPYTNSVDVFIIIKDLWPVGFGVDLNSLQSATTGIWNKNVFGMGHEISYQTHWDFGENPHVGHSGKYFFNNIGRTFLKASVAFENRFQTDALKLTIGRGFFTPEIKYAGGYIYENFRAIRDIRLIDSVMQNVELSYNFNSIWLGRSFPFSRSNLATKGRSNIIFSARWMDYRYFRGPELSDNLFYNYQNRSLFLISLGFSQQAYFKSNLINGFGDTEDIPYGSLLTITAGHEWSAIQNRQYLGLGYAKGKYYKNAGFIYNSLKLGGFITTRLEQGVFSYSFDYFSPALITGQLLFRIYAAANYKKGLSRNYDEFLEISNRYDVRGLSSDTLKGYEKLSFNLEARMFSPRHFYGFRPVYYIFADFGLINYTSDRFLINPWNSSIGIGIRFRNERLVFNTFQIRLAYFPLSPTEADKQYFNIAGRPEIMPKTFTNAEPGILTF